MPDPIQSTPAVAGAYRMPREEALDRFWAYADRYGDPHIELACHAAFPLLLSPELVNLTRINFLNEDVPWIAEADLLLSNLCKPIGGGFFQLDAAIREVLLVELLERYPDGSARLRRLADFLLAYCERNEQFHLKPEYVRIYQWVAWSILDPQRLAANMARLLEQGAATGALATTAPAAQLQVALMLLDVLRAPLENGAPPDLFRDLIASAQVLAEYWYRDPSIVDKLAPSQTEAPAGGELFARVVSALQPRPQPGPPTSAEPYAPATSQQLPLRPRVVTLLNADALQERTLRGMLGRFGALVRIGGADETFDFAVHFLAGHQIAVVDNTGSTLVTVTAASGGLRDPETASRVVGTLCQAAFYGQLRDLRNPDPSSRLAEALEIHWSSTGAAQTSGDAGSNTIISGASLQISVTNRLPPASDPSAGRMLVTLLNLASDGSITQVAASPPGSLVTLLPGQSTTVILAPTLVTDATEGIDYLLVFGATDSFDASALLPPPANQWWQAAQTGSPSPDELAGRIARLVQPDPVSKASYYLHDWVTVRVQFRLVQPSPAPQPVDVETIYGGGPVAITSKLWKSGQTLHVAFLDGDPQLQARVLKIAAEWSQYANIQFALTPEPEDAQLRISFAEAGTWAYIGTDALHIALDQPTINFGELRVTTDEDAVRAAVLQRFGIALGLVHGHRSPIANIPWNKELIYEVLEGPPNNWSKAQVDLNYFDRLAKAGTVYGEIDNHSIMMYQIPPAWTDGKLIVPANHDLSPGDKQFIQRLYPFGDESAAKPPVEKQARPPAKHTKSAPAKRGGVREAPATGKAPRKQTSKRATVAEAIPDPPYGVSQVADSAKLWDPGTTLLVYFMDGDPALHERILKVAQEWSQYANITFEQTGSRADAVVRVAFERNVGSWSYIGTDCLPIARDQQTLNLGWVDASTPMQEVRRVTLHEFGHVLGLLHAHQSPAANIPWDRKQVEASYAKLGWSEDQIKANLYDRFDPAAVHYEQALDNTSIMAFPIPGTLTHGLLAIDTNIELSDGDRKFIAELYPYPDHASPRVRRRGERPASSNRAQECQRSG